MKYIIMLALVIGLASADFATGLIKAFVIGKPSSSKMGKGGAKKLGEIVVELTAIGCDIAITMLTQYYPETKELGDILGNYTAVVVTCYIVIMEIISILENFAAVNSNARWAQALARKFDNIEVAEIKKINTKEDDAV